MYVLSLLCFFALTTFSAVYLIISLLMSNLNDDELTFFDMIDLTQT